MTDDLETDEVETDQSPTTQQLRRQLKDANQRVKEANERAAANEAAARRVAFMDAGIPDTAPARFFRDHWDGPNDADSIRNAAAEYGFITPDAATDATVQGIEAMSETAAGGESMPEVSDQVRAEMEQAARNAPRGQAAQRIAEVLAKYNVAPG